MCACVCPLLASSWSHSCLLIGWRSGHDTAESGRDNVFVSLMETLVTHFPFLSLPKHLWLILCCWRLRLYFSVCIKVSVCKPSCLIVSAPRASYSYMLLDVYADVFSLFYRNRLQDQNCWITRKEDQTTDLVSQWTVLRCGFLDCVPKSRCVEYRAEKYTDIARIIFQLILLCLCLVTS